MVVEKDLISLINKLVLYEYAAIQVYGNNVTLRLLNDESTIAFSTDVYYGGGFIPISVRKSITDIPPFNGGSIVTYLTIDENNSIVLLNYIGKFLKNKDQLNQILEEFCWQANEWRLFLDEQERQDLVHIPIQ